MSWVHQSYLPVEEDASARKGRGRNPALQERDRAIIAKAPEMTILELAAKYGVSVHTVRALLSAAKVTAKRAPYPNHKRERNQQWCDLYRAGQSVQQIVDQFGVTRERVCQILRIENLIALKWQRNRLAAELDAEEREKIRDARAAQEENILALVRDGGSHSEVAVKLGIKTSRVAHVCYRHKVANGRHGRWRDFTARINRLRELIEGGHSINAALAIRSQEEGQKQIGYQWLQRNIPELCNKHRCPAPATPAVSAPLVSKGAPAPKPAPPDIWTAERTAELIKLWFGGTSAQQISDIFGPPFTRNAIIGKTHRLRLAGELKPLAE